MKKIIKKDDITIAVVIPYYNGSRWIERAIKSVITQTVAPDEFIIVNDGSEPEERAILDSLTKQYNFRILDKENNGQGSARNTGIVASTSEYISLLDQDDFYLPQHIEDLIGAIPENDLRLGFIYADLCTADGEGNISHSNMLRKRHQDGFHPLHGHISDLLARDLFVVPSASLIKRTAFDAVGGFDVQFIGYEDDDLFLRMFRAGFTNYFLDKPVTIWCISTDSTSYSIKMSRSRLLFFKKLTATYHDNEIRGMYYFRDCLVPRFGRQFISEAIKEARKNRDKQCMETFSILKEYSIMVNANNFVNSKYKIKLKLLMFIITKYPTWMTCLLINIASTPIIRRFW